MAIDNFPLSHASLRHPAGNIPLPEGEPCIAMDNVNFLRASAFLPFCPRVFCLALGCGACGKSRREHGASVGPGQGP